MNGTSSNSSADRRVKPSSNGSFQNVLYSRVHAYWLFLQQKNVYCLYDTIDSNKDIDNGYVQFILPYMVCVQQ